MLDHHEPFPAVVMDRGWNVVRANRGAGHLFAALLAPAPLPEPANVLRMLVAPGPVRDAVVNWAPRCRALLERARREATGGVLDARHAALVDELLGLPFVAAAVAAACTDRRRRP